MKSVPGRAVVSALSALGIPSNREDAEVGRRFPRGRTDPVPGRGDLRDLRKQPHSICRRRRGGRSVHCSCHRPAQTSTGRRGAWSAVIVSSAWHAGRSRSIAFAHVQRAGLCRSSVDRLQPIHRYSAARTRLAPAPTREKLGRRFLDRTADSYLRARGPGSRSAVVIQSGSESHWQRCETVWVWASVPR